MQRLARYASLLLLAALPGTVHAAAYTGEDGWRESVGQFQVETFDDFANLTQLSDLPSIGVRFGWLSDGANRPTVMDIETTGGSAVSGNNVLVNREAPVLPGLGPIVLLPMAGTFFRAVGYWNTGTDDSTVLRVFDAAGSLIEVSDTGAAGLSFNGILSEVPIARVEIRPGALGNGYITLDNLQVSFFPEPASALLLAGGILLSRRRR